jgi:hypothetical protein
MGKSQFVETGIANAQAGEGAKTLLEFLARIAGCKKSGKQRH